MRWKSVVWGAVLAVVPTGVCADHLAMVAVGQHYTQDQPFGPALADEDRFLFTALAVPDSASAVGMQSVSVIRPSGQETGLSRPEPGDPLVFEEVFEALLDLEEAYPEGVYQFRIWTNFFPQSCTVSVELSGRGFPPPPRIANLEEARSIAAGGDFTVQWDLWEGGSAADSVLFTVIDEAGDPVFETPFLGDPAALTGLAVAMTIPAGTLLSGRRYTGELVWLKAVRESTGACPAVRAVAAYYCGTEFPMATAGGSSSGIPALESSLPADGATGVPTAAVVAFRFNEPMSPEAAVTWSTNAAALRWTYRWDETATTLYAIASAPLPGSATVRWT